MMKLLVIIVFILSFAGCATTSPIIEAGSSGDRYKAQEITAFLKNNDISLVDDGRSIEIHVEGKKLDDYLKDTTTKQSASFLGSMAFFYNAPNIYERLGKVLLHQPNRIYSNIEFSFVYERLIFEMKKHKFFLEKIDHGNGMLFGVYEFGTVDNFLIWEWKRKQFITFIVLPVIGSPKTRMYNFSWVEEKPPLSSKYLEVKASESEIRTVKQISDSIDSYVLENGGDI